MSSADVNFVRLLPVDVVVNAVGVGVGVGSLLPGACISPPNASVALEITNVAAKRKHRSLVIVFRSFGVEAVWLSDR
jgi:hypothetical protein